MTSFAKEQIRVKRQNDKLKEAKLEQMKKKLAFQTVEVEPSSDKQAST